MEQKLFCMRVENCLFLRGLCKVVDARLGLGLFMHLVVDVLFS